LKVVESWGIQPSSFQPASTLNYFYGNMILRYMFFTFFLTVCQAALAGGPTGTKNGFPEGEWNELTAGLDTLQRHENERVISTGLAVLLGAFGAHRIYLGTKPHVAVIYGITFGGFGVLALLDVVHILLKKDLAPYRNNDRIIMWGKPKEGPTPR